MKNLAILGLIFLLSGCASSQKVKEKESFKLEITTGMDKKNVEETLGKDYRIYKSETGMAEIWFYKDFYVSFDRNGKVIKFGLYEEK